MNKKNKGEFGYLNYKKKLNAIITAIALLVIIAIFATGLLIFKSRNNYMTLVATVLVLPWAKLAVAYFILIPHKVCPKDVYDRLEGCKGDITSIYDVVVSNSKKPVGICAMAVTDNTIAALSLDKKLDANVTLYTDVDTFIKRAANLAANFESEDENKTDRMGYIKNGTLNMCL